MRRLSLFKVYLALALFVFSTVSFSATYYVNDNSLIGDQWCSAIGTVGGTGAIDSPFLTIQTAANVVNSGDIVYVDTGTYAEPCTLNRGGIASSPIIFQGAGWTSTGILTNRSRVVMSGIGNRVQINCSYVTIRGFFFKNPDDWSAGISTYEPAVVRTNIRIVNNRMISNGYIGIVLQKGYRCLVMSNDMYRNGRGSTLYKYGMSFYQTTFSTAVNNRISHGPERGLNVQEGNNNIFRSNTIVSNLSGISVYGSIGNVFLNNIIRSNSSNGFRAFGNASANTLINNLISGNGKAGILFDDSSAQYSKLQGNVVCSNRTNGFYTKNNTEIVMYSNLFMRNKGVGIVLQYGSHDSLVVKNTVFSNVGRGVDYAYSHRSVFRSNIIRHNGGTSSPGGFQFYENRSNIFENNYLSHNYLGGLIINGYGASSYSNQIRYNISCSNTHGGVQGNGIYSMANPGGNIYMGNTCFSNFDGIKMEASRRDILIGNFCSHNRGSGIAIVSNGIGKSTNIFMSHNISASNYLHGIYVQRGVRITMISNTLFSNSAGIFLQDRCLTNIITGNRISYNWKGSERSGILLKNDSGLLGSENTKLYGNIVYSNFNGVKVLTASNTQISRNWSYMNSSNGITVSRRTNITTMTMRGNIVFKNGKKGISLNDTGRWLVRNNTVFSNIEQGFYFGVGRQVVTRNNLSVFNGSYGFLDNGTQNTQSYNDSYGNMNNPTNTSQAINYSGSGGAYPGVGSFTQSRNPLFQTTDHALANFVMPASYSWVVDAGSPDDIDAGFEGERWDMGAVEMIGQRTALLRLTKTLDSITSPWATSISVPGAKVRYMIQFTNEGPVKGSNVMVVDLFPRQAVVLTNSALLPAGFTNEFSTNSDPDQSYLSTDYVKSVNDVLRIKWIRWRLKSINMNESMTIYYSVIIK